MNFLKATHLSTKYCLLIPPKHKYIIKAKLLTHQAINSLFVADTTYVIVFNIHVHHFRSTCITSFLVQIMINFPYKLPQIISTGLLGPFANNLILNWAATFDAFIRKILIVSHLKCYTAAMPPEMQMCMHTAVDLLITIIISQTINRTQNALYSIYGMIMLH